MKIHLDARQLRPLATLLAFLAVVPVTLQPTARSQAAASSQSSTGNTAEAKAAARKKKFEEEKARLEGTQRKEEDPCASGKPVLYITPTEASMLVGESRGFTLFDTEGHKLTTTADWSISNSSYATLTMTKNNEPTVTAIGEGTFELIARVDSRTTEATVKVYPGNQLPIGTVQWRVAPIPCSNKGRISRTVAAVPH